MTTSAAPEVSVIIPSRAGETLERAVQSALDQSGVDVEVIVVLNDPVRPFEPHDERVRVLSSEPEERGNGARRAGIAAARAPYVALLDDDDYWHPHKLRSQLSVLRNSPQGSMLVVGCWLEERDREGHAIRVSPRAHQPIGEVRDYLFRRSRIVGNLPQLQTSTLVFPTALGRAAPFDPALTYHQDWSWLIAAQDAGATFTHVAQPLAFREISGSASVGGKITWAQSAEWALGNIVDDRLIGDFLLVMVLPKALRRKDAAGARAVFRLARDHRPGWAARLHAALTLASWRVRRIATTVANGRGARQASGAEGNAPPARAGGAPELERHDPRPTVSVIVPAYRAAKTIEQLVICLLEQDEHILEVIIVSDGAVDDTPAIAARLAAQHSRVRSLVLPDNVGVARAREAGIRAAAGEYVLFTDADDSMPADAIATLVDRAVATRADVVIGSVEVLRPSGDIDYVLRGPREFTTVSRLFAFRLLLRGDVTGHLWNKLVRRSVLEACLPFPTSDVHSDLALTARTLASAVKVSFADTIVYRYHANPGSILKSGRSRLASLDKVEASVRSSTAAVHPALLDTDDYRYFTARFISLSRVKDALVGPYTPADSRRLARAARRRLGWDEFALTVRRRDLRRAAMIVSARVSLRVHGAVLSRGRRSAGTQESRRRSSDGPRIARRISAGSEATR